MIIGIPKEIKEQEYRVGMTPSGVETLVREGHRIIVEEAAGAGSGLSDEDYQRAGAEVQDKHRLFNESELIIKVKEPLPSEYNFFRDGQAVFTFLHLASSPELVNTLLKKNIAGFAYETLEIKGAVPLLMPMSEIAGKMAPVVAAYYLQKIHGGAGILATGACGVSPARFLILGAGTAGVSALEVACGLGADVTVLNRGREKLDMIDEMYGDRVKTIVSTNENIEAEVTAADVIVGAVYVTGARTPVLVSKGLVSKMKKGSVIVDVSVDQGGCIETSKPTTHDNPVFMVDGIIHYCVANMPGAYPRTSTMALTNRTLGYIKMLAGMGIEKAATDETCLKSALNTYKGKLVHSAVAESIQKISSK
jgi:alanine dehydrogenase